MAIPDESTTYCSRCSSYNIGTNCCVCKSCTEDIIDKWVDECDKLFETLDINNLKRMFGIVLNSETEDKNE